MQILSKDTLLAHIIDLNGLGLLFQRARDENVDLFREFPGVNSNDEMVDWLSHWLNHTQREEFVAATLCIINRFRQVTTSRATWVTLWKNFLPCIPEGPDRWLEVLGIFREGFPRWLIVLRYQLAEGGSQFKPTQRDAGASAYFFPSPPRARVGHPIDLRLSPLSTRLSAELIHRQIFYSTNHWREAGGLCASTTRSSPNNLREQRLAHIARLSFLYGSRVFSTDWLTENSQ